MAGRMDIKAGKAFVELYLKNNLSKGLKAANKELHALGDSAIRVGKTMATIGATAAIPIAYLTKTFMDFDDAMRMVAAVSQSTDAELTSLTKTAKQLGASTSFTAIQVANLMGELGRAGFSAAQIEKMTGAVLDLSRATGTDATLASGIMAASIRQFGLGAEDATRVADALTMAANASFNSVESLGEAMSYAGPVAADFNMSIEDTLAVLGALGNVGIQGSNAGTAVRRLLTLSAAEAEKFQDIFGVATKDAAGNARPLVDVLDEINKATASLGTADRAAKFNEAFGLLGITSASAISKNAVAVKDLQKKIYEAGGTAATTAKKMDAGLGGAFRIMMSAIEGVQIALGDRLAPLFMQWAGTVERVAGLLIKLAENNEAAIQSFAKGIIKITAAGGALIALGIAAKGAAIAIGLISSPLSLLGIALGAGVVAWANWTESGQKATGTLQTAWESVVGAISSGDLELAAKIAMAGFTLAFREATFDIHSAWIDLHRDLAIVLNKSWASMQIVLVKMQSAWDKVAGEASLFARLLSVDKANSDVKNKNDAEQAAIDKERKRINLGTVDPRNKTLLAQRARENRELDARQKALDEERKKELSPEQIAETKRTIARGYNDGRKNDIDSRDKQLADIDTKARGATALLVEDNRKQKERIENDRSAAKGQLENLRKKQAQVAANAELDALEADLVASFKEEARRKKAAAEQVDTAAAGAGVAAASSVTPGNSTFGSFSAAALSGQGGVTVQDRMLMEMKETKKIDRESLEVNKKILASLEPWERPLVVDD